jgi:hypothetical protein
MTYEVWMGGWSATGGSGSSAQLLGRFDAESFNEACRIAAKVTGQLADYSDSYLLQTDQGVKRIPQRPAIWGCCLYDNEADARKLAG